MTTRINWTGIKETRGVLAGVNLDALEELHGDGLRNVVKHSFDLNGVPECVIHKLEAAEKAIEAAINSVEDLAETVLEVFEEDGRDETGRKLTAEEIAARKEAADEVAQRASWAEQSKHRPASR